MRIPTLSALLLSVCCIALSACADENGNTPIGAHSTVTPVRSTGVACAPITGSGVQDNFHETVTLTKGADGLQSGDIVVGTGVAVAPHQTVTVNYTGWLTDGQVFDTSRQTGRTPTQFGLDGVIAGWTEGLVGMRVGGKRRLVIPGPLAYGSRPPGGCIGANATLTFDVELISIDKSPAPSAS